MSKGNFVKQAEELRAKADKELLQKQMTPTRDILQHLDNSLKENSKSITDEIYRRAIENIKISEIERIKINKNDFSNKDEVIDILLYIVGKMAIDPIFYDLNIVKLKDHKPLYKNN